MTNLEMMEKAVAFTTKVYSDYYSDKLIPDNLPNQAAHYSAQALYDVLTSSDGTSIKYPIMDNLRSDMASLGRDAIKNELLKNVVNVGTYYATNNPTTAMQLGDYFRTQMNAEQIAVVLFNNVAQHGIEKGYNLLDDPNILFNACFCFAKYRSPAKREIIDYVGQINNKAIYLRHELDVYYTKHGDKQDVSNMGGFSYLDGIVLGNKK